MTSHKINILLNLYNLVQVVLAQLVLKKLKADFQNSKRLNNDTHMDIQQISKVLN
jgi:hypothetical protein